MEFKDDGFFWDGGGRQRVFEIFPKVHGDRRGFFCEIFNSSA
jgi:hypothetical protein